MSDGSYQAVVYSYPVHELVDGVWVEIESTNQNARGDVSPSDARSNIIDNFVWDGHGVQNNNAVGLDIGLRSGYRCRAFIRFATMPTIPAGSTITAATMTVNIVSGTSTANNAAAYQVDSYWESATIQWSDMPSLGTLQAASISHNNKTKYQFSCLEAVKDWYNGSTTGQNKNYGIMLRYADETINDYNSFYSADYSNAALRPSLTISYTPSISLDVDEGKTLTLSASGATGTVTWTSSNSSLATVNSSGIVTGVKAGKVTITAFVNGVAYKVFTVYVTIADGVYRLRSNAGLYLATNGGYEEYTDVKLVSYVNYGNYKKWQLWKITYLGGGLYSIRPMHEMTMGLHANLIISEYADIVSIGTSDTLSALDQMNRWGISANADGDAYYLNNAGMSSRGLRAENNATTAGIGVTIEENTFMQDEFEWSLIEVDTYSFAPIFYEISTQGFVNYSCSRYIAAGTAAVLADIDLALFSYGENYTDTVTWSCKSGSQHIFLNTNTGAISARTPGTALVSASNGYGSIDLYITVTRSTTADFTIINHYDTSFMDDNQDGTIDEEDSGELISLVDDAIDFVNDAYYKQFGITISSYNEPYYRTGAVTEQCLHSFGTNCHEEPACEGICNVSHHKNLVRISDHFYSSTIPNDHVMVFWTNRDALAYCIDGMYTIGVLGDIYACVYKYRPVIHMTQMERNDDTKLACMATILAHEFAHTLGLTERTDDAHMIEPGEENQAGNCVMETYVSGKVGEFYNAVKADRDLFCSSCEAEVRALIEQKLGL